MTDRQRYWRDILLYLALATVLSGLVDAAIIAKGKLGAGFGLFAFTLMWTPAIAALLTCRWRGIPLDELGWRWPATRWILAGWLIPFGYALAAYAVVWVSGLGRYAEPGYVAEIERQMGATWLPREVEIFAFTLLAGTAGVLRACASALGEEIGWRGFLVPRLARVMSPLRVALVTGVIWTLYHVPILVGADYNSGTPVWWGLSCFTLLILSGSVVFTWLRLQSNSLWPAVLLHASHNAFIQGVFTPLTGDTGHTKWIVDEFGLAVPLANAALALWIIFTGRLNRRV